MERCTIFCILYFFLSFFFFPPFPIPFVSLIQRRSFLSPLRRRITGRQNSRLGGTFRFSFDTSRLVGRASGLYKCKSIKLATKLRLLSKKPPLQEQPPRFRFRISGKIKGSVSKGRGAFFNPPLETFHESSSRIKFKFKTSKNLRFSPPNEIPRVNLPKNHLQRFP